MFCKAFGAKNLSRSDISADASKDGIGLAIKTFLDGNGKSFQKVAEFNSDSILFRNLSLKEKIRKVAELRNERLETTKRISGLTDMFYHCIVRRPGKILVYEAPVRSIDIENISDIIESSDGNTIRFSDPLEEYSFSTSKSTLLKRFVTKDILIDIPVKVFDDPFGELSKLMAETGLSFSSIKDDPHVFLPLYSGKGGNIHVPVGSGLNLWNAGGRARKPDEVYIPIPSWIHLKFPNFFPSRHEAFNLILPDGKVLAAKVCQQGSKALMSNPNTELGAWILRNVLRLKSGELVTYEKLQSIGLDSVVVYRTDAGYSIDFARIGSYADFLIQNDKVDDATSYADEEVGDEE
jgi:hypothetical protein